MPTGVTFVRAAAGNQSFALDTDGQVWAWGGNALGQLGIGVAEPNHSEPTMVNTFPAGIAIQSITAGPNQAFAIDTNGDLWAWGINSNAYEGILGDGTATNRDTPVKIPQP